MTPLLVLCDVDGTLLLSHDPLAVAAFFDTLGQAYGVELHEETFDHVDHAGQTALRIARLVLREAGFDDDRITPRLAAWCVRFGVTYAKLLADADTSRWRAAPHAEAALVRLRAAGHRLALLTGNPEPMARARMERLGLSRCFPSGQGAFGCDAESRTDLIGIARERAGGWPASATVEIGDTRRDASSAHDAGVRSIIVDGSGFSGAVSRLLASSA